MSKLLDEVLLKKIAGINLSNLKGAYNVRKDGQKLVRNTTNNIDIKTKEDKDGIDIIVKENTKNETVYIPVILTKQGLNDKVYNDFYIGKNADVTIVAGCGIHSCGNHDSEHDGIHTFYLEEGAKVKYVEKHYGEGDGNGKRILNPETIVNLEKGSTLEMETVQIKGVDSTIRITKGNLKEDTNFIVSEKIMTHGNQYAKTVFDVNLNGKNSSTKVTSRSIAKDNSKQEFVSNLKGNDKCFGHVECDAIIMDNAVIKAIPEIEARNIEANLIHEAAIGKIAGEQLIKLMSLGLTEKQAEKEIINGFLK